MRQPTPHSAAYRWHSNALKGVYGEVVDLHDEPQCGFFKRRLVKGGPYVPARIWLYAPTGDDGELTGDETLQCEVNGQWADAEAQWSYLAGHPISEAEFNYLTALLAHTASHEPDDPLSKPRERIDWMKVPIPQFSKESNNAK